jgi:diguanylate cyclase (GGDEF)-like protein/putative nucleotidyltransferase with HDIG domain
MTNRFAHERAKHIYFAIVIAAGTAVIVGSVYQLITSPIPRINQWFLLAGLTLISGSATVRLPSVPATISISEVFVFTSVLLFGTSAGTVTVALDALVMSFWLAKRRRELHRILFNVSGASFSCWTGSQLFFSFTQIQPLVDGTATLGEILPGLIVFALTYFLLNSWTIAFAIAHERREPPFAIWRQNFVWLSLNYFFGASVSALLVVFTRNIDLTVLAIIVPALLALYFTYKFLMARVEDTSRHLNQVNAIHLSTIETLAMAIDAKDQITHGHIRRVQQYSVALAQELGITDSDQIKAIQAASLLHDLGKLAVPEYILNKPGPLTPAEFEKMKLHASVGADILTSISFPYPVVPIVRHHHEQWNGQGYPDGLKGTDIPIGARILSVVDCFDALTSDRPYRPRLTEKEALNILHDRRGIMYDPLVVDAFTTIYSSLPGRITAHGDTRALRAITNAAQPLDPASSFSKYETISASAEETLTLYDLARSLAGQVYLSDAVDVIGNHLRRIVPASVCAFYLYDSEMDVLVAAHATGDSTGMFAGIRIPLGQRLTGWVAAHRQTIMNSDPVLDLGEIARTMQHRPRSCLSTPLVSDGELVGVLTLYSSIEHAFSDDHKRIVELIAKQISRAVKSAADLEAKRHSLTDRLTGLPNIAHLQQFVEAEIAVGGGAKPSLAIVFMDVKGLKTINNSFGREAGDAVLSRVAELTRRHLRGADILFRYGSDEFVALLTQTDGPTAIAICRRIAGVVKQCSVVVPSGDTINATVDVGVATAPMEGQSLEELIVVARRQIQSSLREPNAQDSSEAVH